MLTQFKAMVAGYWDAEYSSQGRSLAAPGVGAKSNDEQCYFHFSPFFIKVKSSLDLVSLAKTDTLIKVGLS